MPGAGCGCHQKQKEGQRDTVTEGGPLNPRSGKPRRPGQGMEIINTHLASVRIGPGTSMRLSQQGGGQAAQVASVVRMPAGVRWKL